MSDAYPGLYRRHRYPAEVISLAVLLYFRFPLSLRMVEDMLSLRGITVSHETIRRWAEKFGRVYVKCLRVRSNAGGDKWHLDEVVIKITGKTHWLWRAVDQNGFVLDILMQRRRDRKAAMRLMRKLMKKQQRAPRVMITDRLRSYSAARETMKLSFEHRSHKGLNNRAENSHQLTRRRERIMKRFKSARQAQRFLSIHDPIANLFHSPRNTINAKTYRANRAAALATWAEISGVTLAP
jgi:putative transposase